MEKELLMEFFRWLERRGFLDESLQYDPEHQVETFLAQNGRKSGENGMFSGFGVGMEGEGGKKQ